MIVKQPNGKYAIWSTICDNFIATDCSREELIEELVADERARITIEVDDFISGKKPRTQFSMSFEECLETIEAVHGEASDSRFSPE